MQQQRRIRPTLPCVIVVRVSYRPGPGAPGPGHSERVVYTTSADSMSLRHEAGKLRLTGRAVATLK